MMIRWKERTNRWVLMVPAIMLAAAVWIFVQGEGEARVLFERAHSHWRASNYPAAAELFQQLADRFPDSSYADDALWEAGLIQYVNLYEVDRARRTFDRLVEAYPESPRAPHAHLKLAEMYKVEMNETEPVILHLRAALRGDLALTERRDVQFELAQNYFLQGDYSRALSIFTTLAASLGDGDLGQWARVRAGTILQILRRYPESVQVLQQVLSRPECPSCQQQARLALVESYEFLDQLSKAIDIARGLDSRYYPQELKDRLLARLSEKRQYYEPRLWKTQ